MNRETAYVLWFDELFLIVCLGISNITILIAFTITFFISLGNSADPKRRKLTAKYHFGSVTPISSKRLIPINCVIVLQIISINTNTIVSNVVFT